MARSTDPEEPLQVKVVVYDLLPPSRLGSLLNFIGSGVYHSSVQLSLPLGPSDLDPSPLEYAFGGHDEPGLSGIFSIPAGTAASRMPGLRYYTTVDCGDAFGDDWRRAFRPQGRDGSGREARSDEAGGGGTGAPYGGWAAVGSRSTVNLASGGDGDDPFQDPAGGEGMDDDDDGGASDGTGYMTRAERRAWRIIQDLKRDPEWNGTKYRLLEKNCNHLTHELVWRLTGRRPPSWLNRAAWVATSLPCIVPAGWIDDADQAAPTAETAHIPDPAHLAGDDDTLIIKPPRADKMDLGGRPR
ncbi:hypothetical protein JCM3775_006324 [Rhodotorula graminis]|uniref:PPPDE domain-containing protein n=1 Tax=Rhodotorula graminis (strain WP1) TaxID=578459 RepID=A0A194SBW3_RHOGW|nr:uncharacterized protein RHOBADRAFT_40635 [Rhodotorula graminis WP1]KPV78092.1 hypothetical protein RHOBADRAFT_40635 [Rhodotorula graminis WP1]